MMAGQTKLPIVTCVWCILVALSGCLPRGSRVLTEELAIERAVQATGVSRDRVRATVSQVTLSEQIVPFIEKSATRDAWRVDLSNVVITQIDGAQILINPHIKSLSVWVSSQTGQVIKVASPPP